MKSAPFCLHHGYIYIHDIHTRNEDIWEQKGGREGERDKGRVNTGREGNEEGIRSEYAPLPVAMGAGDPTSGPQACAAHGEEAEETTCREPGWSVGSLSTLISHHRPPLLPTAGFQEPACANSCRSPVCQHMYPRWCVCMKISWWNLSFLQCMYTNKKKEKTPLADCDCHLVVVPSWWQGKGEVDFELYAFRRHVCPALPLVSSEPHVVQRGGAALWESTSHMGRHTSRHASERRDALIGCCSFQTTWA